MARFAYAAAATLCLAHIIAAEAGSDGELVLVAHQRQGDVGLAEAVGACLDTEEEGRRMGEVLRALIGILGYDEGEDASWGVVLLAVSGEDGVEDERRRVSVWIPHLGVVEVTRGEVGAGGARELVGEDWALGGVGAMTFEDTICELDELDRGAADDAWPSWMDGETL